jgi:hypothetical protein
MEGDMPWDEPAGGRLLWESAQREKDPDKLAALIDQTNRFLTESEKAAAEFLYQTKARKRKGSKA